MSKVKEIKLEKITDRDTKRELMNFYELVKFSVFSRTEGMKDTLEMLVALEKLLSVLESDEFKVHKKALESMKKNIKESIKYSRELIEEAKENNKTDSKLIKQLEENIKIQNKEVFANKEFVEHILPLARTQHLTKNPESSELELRKLMKWKGLN